MKFKLPRQIISEEVSKIANKERKRQKILTSRANKADVQGIAAVSKIIEDRGLPEYLVRKKLPGKLGYGLFLHPKAKPILKNQIIAPYSGEISLVPQNEHSGSDYIFSIILNISLSKKEQQLLDSRRRYHPRRLYSLELDALKKGNFTRFINHSEQPNIAAHLLKIPKNPYGLSPMPFEIVYIAEKTIRPGEQLLVCYEDDEKSYWSALGIKPFPLTPKTFTLSPALKLIKSSQQ